MPMDTPFRFVSFSHELTPACQARLSSAITWTNRPPSTLYLPPSLLADDWWSENSFWENLLNDAIRESKLSHPFIPQVNYPRWNFLTGSVLTFLPIRACRLRIWSHKLAFFPSQISHISIASMLEFGTQTYRPCYQYMYTVTYEGNLYDIICYRAFNKFMPCEEDESEIIQTV